MRNIITPSRPATTAIAAVLAFTANPLLAQETGPAPLPVPSPPPASSAPAIPVVPPVVEAPGAPTPTGSLPAPVITASPTVAAPAVSRPVVQSVPVTAAPGNTAGTAPEATANPGDGSAVPAPAATANGGQRSVAAAPPATEPAAAPSPAGIEPVAIAPAAAPAPPPVAEIAPDAATPAIADDGQGTGNTEFVIGALLAALAAGGLGAIVLSGRRRRTKAVKAPVVDRPVVERPVVNPPLAGRAPVENHPPRNLLATGTVQSAFPVGTASALSPALAHSGAAVALPQQLPATASERRALLDRMVAARPDRANPFRTRKARRHRARLIMQSIGRTFETGKSRIDLSQYPMNWPELAQNRTAAA